MKWSKKAEIRVLIVITDLLQEETIIKMQVMSMILEVLLNMYW